MKISTLLLNGAHFIESTGAAKIVGCVQIERDVKAVVYINLSRSFDEMVLKVEVLDAHICELINQDRMEDACYYRSPFLDMVHEPTSLCTNCIRYKHPAQCPLLNVIRGCFHLINTKEGVEVYDEAATE